MLISLQSALAAFDRWVFILWQWMNLYSTCQKKMHDCRLTYKCTVQCKTLDFWQILNMWLEQLSSTSEANKIIVINLTTIHWFLYCTVSCQLESAWLWCNCFRQKIKLLIVWHAPCARHAILNLSDMENQHFHSLITDFVLVIGCYS